MMLAKQIATPLSIMILSHIGRGNHENIGTPLSFWVPIIALAISLLLAFVNLLLYLNNRKTFSLLYSRPIPEIIKIDTRPTTMDEGGGFISICSMRIKVYNPSSFGNHVKIGFRKRKNSLSIIDKEFGAKIPTKETDYYPIPPFGHSYIEFNLHYDEAKKYIDQTITLIAIDIKKNESVLDFTYKDQPAFLKT